MKLDIQNLRESNEFLNTLLANITSAIFIADKDCRIQSFNNSFKSIFYKNGDLILGELWGNALGCINSVQENADCGTTQNCEFCSFRASLLQTFIKKVPVDRVVLSRKFQINGQLIHKYFQYSTRNISFNNEDMILVLVDDITESENQKVMLSEKNKRLEELNKQKNELLGIAAHDLRNPLSVINSFSDLMIETYKEQKPETIQEMLQILKKTSHFTLQLLNDLLDFSKIESGVVELRKLKLNYYSFVKENIAQNELISAKKKIPIKLQSFSDQVILEFDPRRMDQVLNNLISNAIKFSFPEKEISVIISQEDEFIKTTVKDQGQGIPEKDLPHIYKPFRKVSVKPTDNEKSTGLGLAIVKKIIDFHEGKITVNSTPGEGSQFHYYLPV